jgi:hypothetical protein
LKKIQEWFNCHEPFDKIAVTVIWFNGYRWLNPDKTEEVVIQLQLNGKSILEGSIKRSDHIKPLSHLQPAIQVEKQKVHIDPTILFSRLIAIAEREENMKPYFDYELSSFPTSLFKDGFMR